ncbi:MAG: hypothetical protein GKS01_09035 [Alphaproteobacteria bacterium]|nr:hypothetical protein [Alphaproteobacteria bacterium]
MKTGKTVTDHAVSAVAGRDCQLLHGVTKGQVCESDGRSKKIDLKSMPIADTGKETTMRLEGAKTHRGGKKYIKKPTDRWVVVVGTFPDLYVSSTCDHKFIA